MWEIFGSFNLSCEPAVGFIGPFFLLSGPWEVAAMQKPVVMEMVDNKGEGEAAAGSRSSHRKQLSFSHTVSRKDNDVKLKAKQRQGHWNITDQ